MSVIKRGFRNIRASVERVCYAPGFSQAEQERATRAAIAAVGLDCTAGLDTLDAVLRDIRTTPFNFAKDSVHWLLFACLGKSTGSVARILEIGTFHGQFTAILARLFPAAEIVTVDLPESDPILRSTYGRQLDSEYQRFVATRSRNLTASNIHFRQFNSAFLLDNVRGPFDLIWVDGGHLYPEVAWDIATTHHLCREGGYLLCDDVIPMLNGQRTANVSPDSFQVLRYVTDRTGATLHLFLKRCGFKHAVVPRTRKYVAMLARLKVADAG